MLSYENLPTCHESFTTCERGYVSEKSPVEDSENLYERFRESSEETQTSVEDQFTQSLPRLRLPGGEALTLKHLMSICPFINDGKDDKIIKN